MVPAIIRELHSSDARKLAYLINSIFPRANVSESVLLEKLERGTVFFVAATKGELLGFVELVLRKKTAFIQGIGLKKEFEGKGIGGALLEKAVEKSLRKGKAPIRLITKSGNARAIGFYKAHGFELVKEKRGRGGMILVLEKTTTT